MNNKKKKIEYIQILKDAWKIIWNNKYLWWFGFFIALGGGGGFNFQLPINNNGSWEKKTEASKEEILGFINNYFEWIAAGLVILAVIMIILLVLRIISQAAIIKSVDGIKRGEKSGFSIGFKKGRKYFWKLLMIDLIFGFLVMGILIAFFLPVVFFVLRKILHRRVAINDSGDFYFYPFDDSGFIPKKIRLFLFGAG